MMVEIPPGLCTCEPAADGARRDTCPSRWPQLRGLHGAASFLAIARLTAFALTLSSASAHALMSCAVMSVTGVGFGPYDPQDATPVDSTGSISYRCTDVGPGDAVEIRIGRGNSSRFVPRSMIQGNARLEYNLFVDAARTVVWGDGTGGTAVYTRRVPDGTIVAVPVFGRLPPRQNVVSGDYSDLVVITVLF
jgi:spore coat protein U-like protein